MTGVWTIIYAVFSFGFDSDPEQCVVSNKKDLIATRFAYVDSEDFDSDNPDMIDVAVRFKFFFNYAFILSSVQLIVGTLSMIYANEKSTFNRMILRLFWLVNTVLFCTWGFALLVRYLHSGQECSGDLIV